MTPIVHYKHPRLAQWSDAEWGNHEVRAGNPVCIGPNFTDEALTFCENMVTCPKCSQIIPLIHKSENAMRALVNKAIDHEIAAGLAAARAARADRWGVWGGATGDEPAHWLAAHTGRTVVFPTKEIAEEVARMTALNGLHYEARRFQQEPTKP